MVKHTSVVWEHVEKLTREDRSRYMRCKYDGCGEELAGHLASNAKRHLLTVHAVDLYGTDEHRRRAEKTSVEQLVDNVNSLRSQRSDIAAKKGRPPVPVTPSPVSSPAEVPAERAYSLEPNARAERRRQQTREAVSRHRKKKIDTQTTSDRIKGEIERLKECETAAPYECAEHNRTALIDQRRSVVRTATHFAGPSRSSEQTSTLMQNATIPFIRLRPVEERRLETIHPFISAFKEMKLDDPTEGRYMALVAREDITLVLRIMSNVRVWQQLKVLRRESTESWVMRGLYNLLRGGLAALIDIVIGRITEGVVSSEFDYHYEMIRQLGRFEVPPEYLPFLEPPTVYDDAVIVDVLKATRSGYVSFNFYEKCAASLPRLRQCLKDHIYEMPREKADFCELKPSYALYKRRWAFTDESGDSHKKEDDAENGMYAVRRLPETLRRYDVNTLAITFDSSSEDPSDWLDAYDCSNERFRAIVATARARRIRLSGFDTAPVVLSEQIDRAKMCVEAAPSTPFLHFAFIDASQLQVLLSNGRKLDKTVEYLKVTISPDSPRIRLDCSLLLHSLRRCRSALDSVCRSDAIFLDIQLSGIDECTVLVDDLMELYQSECLPPGFSAEIEALCCDARQNESAAAALGFDFEPLRESHRMQKGTGYDGEGLCVITVRIRPGSLLS